MMRYRKCGLSGLYLPEISLGLWQNFGNHDPYERSKEMVNYAFDQGITHFDLANNYGPDPGSAETTFGKILKEGLFTHRDQMIISTKAGHQMWDGPYGDGGSRKYLFSSLDQSLSRMGLEYVDIFYSHRYVTSTPLEETLQALVDIVRRGKALYIGISKYPPEQSALAFSYLQDRDVPCLVHQDRYSMINREPEEKLFPLLQTNGVGMIAFSSLAQGVLTGKYLGGVPQQSRLAQHKGTLTKAHIAPEVQSIVSQLSDFAHTIGLTLPQLALKWVLRHEVVCSTVIGASSVAQIKENINVVNQQDITENDQSNINSILSQSVN